LPRITGFIAIGLLLGPSGAGLLNADMLDTARVLVDVALGLILFQVGRLLDMRAVLRDRALLAASLLESGLAFAAIYWVLRQFAIGPVEAALAAAIGMSSSPAVVAMVARELGAKGPVTDNTLALVALNNAFSFFAFTLLMPYLHHANSVDWTTAIWSPVWQLLLSLLLAAVLAWLLLQLAKRLNNKEGIHFALLVGAIVGSVGLAQMLNASPLLTILALGILSRNLDSKSHILPIEFGHAGELFFVILFVFAGANLHLADLWLSALPALAFVAARSFGKGLGVLALSAGPLSVRKSALTSLTLMPMAGMALGLTQTAQNLYPAFTAALASIILGGIAILETLGPIATEAALKWSGEVAPDSPVDH
jgi:Kef-type K+ transport system membrane component KefB